MEKTSESSVALGRRLKQVRELNGMSQRELGRRAGVTNSNISMIEQGLVSPSVTSLERLLAVIPMSLEQFFTWDPETAEGQVFRAESFVRVKAPGAGLQIQRLPAASLTLANEPLIYLERCCFAPGSDTGAQSRKETQVLVGWLLEGELQLSMGASVFSLSKNDGFYLPAQQLYRLRNLTEVDAILMWTRGVQHYAD